VPEITNPMRDQILATPAALKAGFAELELAARLVLATPDIYRTRRIVLIGSGDSQFAAKAAEMALISHAGLPVEVRTPLEAGRYHATLSSRKDLENTLVIALSNSGAAARVCEAAGLYRKAGAKILAVTKNSESRLAGLADATLRVPVPALPNAPGFGAYLFAFVALILLGLRIGEVRMGVTMDEAQVLRKTLLGHFDDLEAVIAATDAPARVVAEMLAGKDLLEFVGAGPNAATAEYGAAKILEASGRHALARDLEEWTHLNYFDAAPDRIATVMAIPAESRAASRALELLAHMKKLGRAVVVIGGGPAAERAAGQGFPVLTVASPIAEIWSPLLLSAPLALVAAHLAALTGAAYGRGGRGPWADSADASTVQKSEFWEPGL
jgi:glutamine---fructose-6-phosphate transaminase (isomerizing)